MAGREEVRATGVTMDKAMIACEAVMVLCLK